MDRAGRSPLRSTLIVLITALSVITAGIAVDGLTRTVAAIVPEPLDVTQAESTGVDIPLPTEIPSAVGFGDGSAPLWSSGSTDAVPIASIAKIVTALVVLDAKPIDEPAASPVLTFTDDDVQIQADYQAQNGSTVTVTAGMQLTEYEVLEVMLMRSANNFAKSLTNWAFDSQDAYLAAARDWLAQNGLTGTTITDPAGMSASTTATTADLISLGALAMQNSVVATIVGQPSAEISGLGTITTTNTLLIDGIISGIKTGTLAEAGYCLLFAVEVPELGTTAIGVVLAEPSTAQLAADVRAIAAAIRANATALPVAVAGTAVAQYAPDWLPEVTASLSADETMTVFGTTTTSMTLDLDTIENGVAGQQVGTAQFTVTDLRGVRNVVVPVVLDADVTEPEISWRLGYLTRLL